MDNLGNFSPVSHFVSVTVTVTVDNILTQTVSTIVHFCKECVAQ